MSESIKSYIDDLFKYIETYENDYGSFETEAFFQTYNGISAVFQALRQQRDKAIEVDQVFLDKIRQGPINSSDLRQLTVQILISFFESVADTDGQSNRAYLYCRNLRNAKRDVDYLEGSLAPILTRAGSLNNNFKLNYFLLGEIGRFIRTFGSGVNRNLTPEEFDAMPVHGKLLELSIRREELGENLVGDRDSLEFHLQSVGSFEKLSQSSPLLEKYFKKWNYLVEKSFFEQLKKTLSVFWGNVKGLFSSSRYLRLAVTQRNSAYIFYAILIVILILLAVFIPLRWNSYTAKRLAEFQDRIETTENSVGD